MIMAGDGGPRVEEKGIVDLWKVGRHNPPEFPKVVFCCFQVEPSHGAASVGAEHILDEGAFFHQVLVKLPHRCRGDTCNGDNTTLREKLKLRANRIFVSAWILTLEGERNEHPFWESFQEVTQ
jgi:hypothetical protein